ncbi:MAG: tryptophan-rich sensory protein, partial [Clostridia bacterium]|nr:tryptophan-rich sensory protein [Clostridia bacterium]
MKQKIKPYIISILIALAVGALSAFLTRNNMDIYSEVVTPPLSPPSILFPIV